MGLITRAIDTYQSSQSNASSIPLSYRPSSSAAVNRTAESSASPYADSKDVVRASADPPPYTQYADEQPSQPQPPLQTIRQHEPQAQATQRAYQNAQYQPGSQYQTVPQRQPQTQEYRYQMDLPQNYNGGYGSDQGGRRRRDRRGRRSGGGLMHMLINDGSSNQQFQSRPDMYAQPEYGYDDNIDSGRGRRGRRGGRRGGGGPLRMLFEAARKL